jgi:hypothetical protein
MSKATTKEDILEIVYAAIDEFNEMQDADEQLVKKPGSILFSRPGYTEKGVLDSMGIVNLLISIDEALDKDERTVDISFDVNHILENKEQILHNIDSLVNHIYALSQK